MARVRSFVRGITALLAALNLSACATEGESFDRGASERFEIGVTTPDQVIDSLGPPTLDMSGPDGRRILVWTYRVLRGLVVREYKLSALFDSSGRMTKLMNPIEGRVADPF